MKKITINWLTSYRTHFFEVNAHFLNKITHKDKIVLNVLANEGQDLKKSIDMLNENGLETNLIMFNDAYNYVPKMQYIRDNSLEFMFSVDEDCFMNNYAWDFMIESVETILSDSNNMIYTPTLSNGIPSFEMFVDTFLKEEKEELYNDIIKTHMSNLWGATYESLNEHTLQASEWNPDNFYSSVGNLAHFYKGIHPIRINKELEIKLLNIILDHKEDFLKKGDYKNVIVTNRPYLCNNIYAIRTSTLDGIIKDRSLWKDAFDEVPMNLYRIKHGLNMIFADSVFGIHTAFNCINDHIGVENAFFEKFKDIIKE